MAVALVAAGDVQHPGRQAAIAQSQRYPPPPADQDRDNDQRSSLWEQAIEPARAPHAALVAEARRLIAARTPSDLQSAAAKAGEAIALRPGDSTGHFVRGVALESLGRWAECASSYRAAMDLDPTLDRDPDLRQGQSALHGLGICLARAGQLALAEEALERAIARSPRGAEEWLRLGETRIAMGKLREATEALQASTEASGESSPTALNLWLRALAYDRSLQPALAQEAADAAVQSDRYLRQLTNPAIPFIHETEQFYLLGLGWQSASRPEFALAYFRAIANAKAPGPWMRRAREHVELLEQTRFPEVVTRVGPAPIEVDAVKLALRRWMPQLTLCVEALPLVAFDIKITRSRPSLAGAGPRTVPPQPGVTVTPSLVLGSPSAASLDAAIRCMEAVAARIELTPIKDPGTWHHLSFGLIAHPPATEPVRRRNKSVDASTDSMQTPRQVSRRSR